MRHPNWNQKLSDFIHLLQVQNNAGQLRFNWNPFEEGTYNCLTFSSKVVELVTGQDIYGSVAESEFYTTPVEAYKVMLKLGFSSLDQLIGSYFKEVACTHAQKGDLLLVPAKTTDCNGLDWAVAVCDPPNFWAIATAGLVRGRILSTWRNYPQTKAFKVG